MMTERASRDLKSKQDEVAAKTAEFLAKGGKIQKIPYGVVAQDAAAPRTFSLARECGRGK